MVGKQNRVGVAAEVRGATLKRDRMLCDLAVPLGFFLHWGPCRIDFRYTKDDNFLTAGSRTGSKAFLKTVGNERGTQGEGVGVEGKRVDLSQNTEAEQRNKIICLRSHSEAARNDSLSSALSSALPVCLGQ